MSKLKILPLSYFKASGIPSDIKLTDGKNKHKASTEAFPPKADPPLAEAKVDTNTK